MLSSSPLPASDAQPTLIIGCGYLGRRIADLWTTAGRRVVALTRNRSELLQTLGIEPILGDVTDPASLTGLPTVSTVLYAVGLDRTAGKSMSEVYIQGLRNVLDALPPCERFVYVSSTSVYGQTDGSIVDESSPTEPLEDSGKIVLTAERLLRERLPNAIILRFAGIYGPERLLRKQALLKGEPLLGDPEKWLNLIEVRDGARAVLAAEERSPLGETFIIADDEPVHRRDFYTHLAKLLNAPEAKFVATAPGVPVPRDTNRRLTNRKAKSVLGWKPEYANYREGLGASLE